MTSQLTKLLFVSLMITPCFSHAEGRWGWLDGIGNFIAGLGDGCPGTCPPENTSTGDNLNDLDAFEEVSPQSIEAINRNKPHAFAGHYPVCHLDAPINYSEPYIDRIQIPRKECDRQQLINHIEDYHFTGLAYDLEIFNFQVPFESIPSNLHQEDPDLFAEVEGFTNYFVNFSLCGEECPAELQGGFYSDHWQLREGQQAKHIYKDLSNGYKAILFDNFGDHDENQGARATHCTLAIAGTASVADAVTDSSLGQLQIYGGLQDGTQTFPDGQGWNNANYAESFKKSFNDTLNCAKAADSVVITGHSLGGILAQHMGALLRVALNRLNVETRVDVVTWNAPGARILAEAAWELPNGIETQPTDVIRAAKNTNKITFTHYEMEFDPVSEFGTKYEKAIRLVIHFNKNKELWKTHMRTAIAYGLFRELGSKNPESTHYGNPLHMRMEMLKTPCATALECDQRIDFEKHEQVATNEVVEAIGRVIENEVSLRQAKGRLLGRTSPGNHNLEAVPYYDQVLTALEAAEIDWESLPELDPSAGDK